mgnify:CR=1 FL=1
MEGLNTVGHAINNEKSYLDAGCKALLGCTAVAAFIVKNCIPEFHDMSLEEIQEYIIYKKAKSQITPEELAEIQASNTSPVEIGCHIVDDLPDKLNEKMSSRKAQTRERYTMMFCSTSVCRVENHLQAVSL